MGALGEIYYLKQHRQKSQTHIEDIYISMAIQNDDCVLQNTSVIKDKEMLWECSR